MQIRTLFNNTKFLRKRPLKADSRIVLKATRRLVCVLMLLVVGVSAVWGTSYRWANPSVSAKWNDPSISNGPWEGENASYVYVGTNNYPGGSSNDIAYMTGGAGSDYVVTLTDDYTVGQLHINSDKSGPFKITFKSDSTTKRTITVDTLKFVFKENGSVSDRIELVLENVELNATNLYINDTVDSNEAWGGTFKVSQPAGSNSAISVTNTLDIRTKDHAQTVIDFGTVPVSAGSIAVNKNELYGAEVKICTDASVTCGWLNIGDAANNGNSATKTVFSGSGTITTANLDFPNANTHTLTVESGISLGFSGGGSFYQNSTGLITIDGGGTIDFANVTVVTANGSGVEQQGTNFGPELTIQNPPSPPAGETYTFTATGVESFDGSNTISVAIYSSAAKVLKYTFQRTSTGGNPQFSVNGYIVETGSATFSAGETKPWEIVAVNSSNLTEGDGFTLTVYRPDGFPLGSVTWTKGSTTWTGSAGSAGSGDWNDAGNWTNLSNVADLAGKDIELKPPLTNYPAISSDSGAKTLKIPGNTRVTQTAGTFSVESITATGSGFFKASGGTVLFNGTAGTWQSDVNGAESGKSSFVNVTVTAGKSLTLNSDMAVTGDFTVTSGASFSTGTNALVFAGNGTAAAPQKLTAAGVTVGAVTVKSGTVLELQDNLTVGILTIESEAVLNCNGHNITITTSASGAGTIDVNGGTASATAVSISGSGSISEISVTDDTELSLSLSCTKCTVAADKTLTIKEGLSTGTLENNGTISSAGYDITCTTYNGASDGTDAMTLSGNVTLSVGTNTVGSITYAGGGTFAAGSDGIKTGTLNVTGTAGNATLDGTMTLGKLVANDATLGGKMLTINGTLTVGSGVTGTAASQTLVLSGISGSPLTVDGTGTINLNKMQSGGKCLSVGSGPAINLSEGAFSTTYSTGPATPPSGWNIFAEDFIYKWTGDAGTTAWNTAGNWNIGIVPSSTDADVEIPSGLTIYPESPSSELSINSLKVESGASVSVADGTKLRFVSYSGNGVIKLGTGNIEIRSAGTNCTIQNIEFTGTGTRDFADISKVTLVNVKVPAGKTLRLTGNLTLTGELDNAGTVNTNGNTLTLGSYTDSSASLTSLIQIAGNDALALSSGGTGGTVTNLSFTENAEFKDITGFTFKNATIAAGKELKLSGALTFTGTVTNNGSLNVDNKTFACASYSGSGSDAVYANNGTFTSGGGTVKTAQLNGSSAVINNGSGNLVFTAVNVTADSSNLTVTNSGTGTLTLSSSAFTGNATVTSGVSGSASLPAFATVSIGSGKTLTLGSDLTVSGMITNNGTISSAGKNLTCTTYTGASGGTDAMTLSGDVTLSVGTNTIGSITYVDGGTLAGVVNVAKFTASGLGGRTLTINGTITVGNGTTGNAASQTLALSGASGSPLTVGGTGTIKLNKSQTIGAYLAVSSTRPEITKINTSDNDVTIIYTATNSTGTSGNGWNICEGALVYKWTGKKETSTWNTDGNWSVGIAPVTASDDVRIDVIDSSLSYPVTPSADTTIGNLAVVSGASLTVAGRFSAGAVSNEGTVTAGASNSLFRFNSYSGNGVIKLGAGSVEARSAASNVSVTNIEFTGTGERYFANVDEITFVNAVVPAGKTLKLTGDLKFTGMLNNEGTVNTNAHTLTIGSYTDSSGSGIIQIAGNNALALNSSGGSGTIKKLEFTADCSFSMTGLAALSFTDAEVKSGVTLTAGSNLSFGGLFANSANDSAVILSGCNLTAVNFSGSGSYSISGTVEVKSTASTEAGAGKLELVKSSGTASLTQTGLFLIKKLSVESGTLTLNSSIKAVDISIKQSATLYAGPSTTSAYTLTVRGNFVNENTGADPASFVYPGFDARQGTVEFVDNPEVSDGDQIHYVKGFNRFYNFTCTTTGSENANVYFDTDKTTRIEGQLTLEGSSGAGGYLVLDTPPGSADDRKWTLDITWNIQGVNDPVIRRVKPHHSISYRAILHDCLIDCIDDGVTDMDSTNKNWFDDMPSILMTLAPIGGRQLFVFFSTEVDVADGEDLRTSISLKNVSDTTDTVNLINASIPVEAYEGSTGKSKSGIVFTLTRDITWSDLTGPDPLYVEIIKEDAVLKGGSIVPYLKLTKHCLSDYAVNAVSMLFGYDNSIDPSTPLTIETGTNSVRVWDSSNPTVNRLHSESDLLFQAQLEQSVDTGIQVDMVAMLSSQLNQSVIGNNFRDYYGFTTRLWQPFELLAVSTGQQSIPSGQVIRQDGTSSGRLRNFSIYYNKSAADALFTVPDGDEIQFMFKLLDSTGNAITINHDCDGTTAEKPLYAIRLKDDADITSFDLWSVMLQSTTLQRGNVTILNNVINADQREQTFVTIELQKAGSLTVQVLTLDGSVITTLQRGRKQPGTYGYSWDGTNGKGRPVARGMYFIRIIGPDIDETRKVMVVRD